MTEQQANQILDLLDQHRPNGTTWMSYEGNRAWCSCGAFSPFSYPYADVESPAQVKAIWEKDAEPTAQEIQFLDLWKEERQRRIDENAQAQITAYQAARRAHLLDVLTKGKGQ